MAERVGHWHGEFWNTDFFGVHFGDPTGEGAVGGECAEGHWHGDHWAQAHFNPDYWGGTCVVSVEFLGLLEHPGSGKIWKKQQELAIRQKWDELLELKRKYRERAKKGWRTRKRKGLELTEYDPLWDLVQTIQQEMGLELELAKMAAASVIAEAMDLSQTLECSDEQALVLGLEMIEV